MIMQPPENNEFDRRSRLVSLAYEGLRDLRTPADATDSEILTIISQAFLAKTTGLTEPAPLMAREDRMSPMFLTQAVGRLDRRQRPLSQKAEGTGKAME
jgi:hypothetical protein